MELGPSGPAAGRRRCGAALALVIGLGATAAVAAAPVGTPAGTPAGTVAGTARDAAQHALAGVALSLEAADGKVVARTTTAADGRFSFTGVAPGNYAVVGQKQGVGAGTASVTLAPQGSAAADVTLRLAAQPPTEEVTVVATRLEPARIGIAPEVGASSYGFSSTTLQNMPGGESAPISQVLLRAPGVNQDNQANGALHIRNEHLDAQYRINGIILPEGVSFFGQGLTPSFAQSMQLITGALPAEYGLRTAGIVDIQTKSGTFAPGGTLDMYGGSDGTVHPSLEYGGSSNGYNYFFAGDYLQDDQGINAVTSKYNQIHDDTRQLHAFAYVDKSIDASSKLAFIAGSFNGQFQIPDNPGQPVAFTPVDGLTNYDSAALSEHQVESSNFGVLSWLRTEENLTAQVSLFTKYSTLSFHPDSLGDIFFNGIAQQALRQSFANGLQADASEKLGLDHTLRAGVLVNEERASADTNSSVLPITGCAGGGTVADGCAGGVASYGASPQSIINDSAKTGWTYSAYLQDAWKVLPKVTINYGARFDVVNEYTMENQLSPRLNTVWQATDTTTVHAGYANYFSPPPFELVSTNSLGSLVATSASCAQAGTCLNSPVKAERSHYFDIGAEQVVLPGLKVGVDVYYKYSRNLLDEGQFGAPVILTPFNYHVGFNRGVELTTSFDRGNFSYYGNLAIAEQKAEGIASAQFNFGAVPANGCPESDLAYAASHLVNTDHSQRVTAATGVSYLWRGTRYGIDMIAGSGLRTQNFGDCFNEGTVPSYEQFNLGLSHKFDLPYGGPIELRADIINVFDQVYLLRSQTGVGVFASAYGPRRTFYLGIKKEF